MKHSRDMTGLPRRIRAVRPGLFCLGVALIMSTIAGVTAEDVYWLSRRGEVVTATVLSEEPERGGGTTITVSFTTSVGQKWVGDTSNRHSAQVGKPIEILYDREDPDRLQAADWGLEYRDSYLLGDLGAALLLISTALFIGRRAD